MLKSLISGEEDSEFILIEDFSHLKGRGLFQAFIQEHLNRECEIHLLSYNNPPGYISSTHTNKIVYHDGYTDPENWRNDEKIVNKISCDTDLEKHFQTHLTSIPHQKEYLIAIDALSYLILSKGVATVCKIVKNLQRFCKKADMKMKLLCLFHNHSRNDFIVESMEYLASTVLFLSAANGGITECRILHKRSGKPLKEKTYFQLSNNFEVTIEKPSLMKNTSNYIPEQKPDPTSGLTFKLDLEEKEKVARDQLVLPYTKKSNESEIIYEYDENDDFDEEDPDDDLNI